MVSLSDQQVTIVIVNYNLSKEILDCLISLETHLQTDSYRVVIVDNNSSDDKLPELRELVQSTSHFDLINLDQNIGFGAACNKGAANTDTEFVCFLNPDTTVEHDFIESLIDPLESGRCTIVGPVYQNTSLFEFSSGYFPNEIFEALSVFMLGRHLEAAIMALRRRFSGSLLDVHWILGACMLISKKDFDRAGGFDTDFFLFFEEMDLCKRIRDSGGVISVSTDCRINHVGSVSGKKDYALFTERFYQGKLRYLSKQTTGGRRVLLLRLVWLQLHSQQLLWLVLNFLWPDKSGQKRRGLTQALAFYRTIA